MSKDFSNNKENKSAEEMNISPYLVSNIQSTIQPKIVSSIQPRFLTSLDSDTESKEQMPEEVQAKMENSFGQDFSNVNIHTDSDQAKNIGAQAYAQGNNIHFAPGQYNPGSKSGQELLGHELTHVVQQSQGKVQPGEVHGKGLNINNDPALEKEADEMGKLASEGKDAKVSGIGNGVQKKEEQASPAPTKAELDEIVDRYNEIVKKARAFGYNVAADNLQHFLTGAGTTKVISSAWLRNYGAIISAEETNQKRFEKSLDKLSDSMKDGDSKTFSDYWDCGLYAAGLTELYYASGGSTITSRGSFTLSRKDNTVTVTGTVNHHWHDPYDWHEGLTAFIPGYGNISDADALLLQQYRGAKPFEMESDWQQDVEGIINTNRWTDYFGTKYTWTLK